ncbi:unnamed protein product, partial [Closterium sp. NIES-53]
IRTLSITFESATASALVAELLDFAVACHLDYATPLVAESESPSPPSVGGECALGTDVLEDMQEDFEYLSAAAAMDAKMASWKSRGTYIDALPPSRANIVDGMWIFRVKRLLGSPPASKARCVARGFRQRQGVDYFHTFSPTPNMTTLRVLLHLAAQRDYELHSLDFSTTFLQGSLHEEIWHLVSLGRFLQWHDTLRTTLAALGFAPSTADPSLFLRTNTSLPPFYVRVYVDDLVFATADTESLTLLKSKLQKRHTCTDLGELRSYLGLQITRERLSSPQLTPLSTSHSLSAPPSDESVEPSGPYPELVGCLMYLMTCTRPDLAYPLSLLARYVAPNRHRKVHWDATKRVLRYLCSTSSMGLVLGGRGPAEIYARAMAAQELRWLTYLLTDLGEQPRLPPQRGQLRLAYVASWANTADVFTKALPPVDHQRLLLSCFAFLDWSCDHLFSPTLPMGIPSPPLLHPQQGDGGEGGGGGAGAADPFLPPP